METTRRVFTLACAVLLASGACAATALARASAESNASAGGYHSTSKRSRPHARHFRHARRRSGARCAHYAAFNEGVHAVHHARNRGRKRARGPAARTRAHRHPHARAHAHGMPCGRHSSGHRHRTRGTRRHRGVSHRGIHRHARVRRSGRSPSAGRSSVCANTSIMPAADNLELVRAATLCLINRERENAGERALNPVATLATAAQRHTEDMAFGDYFEHIGPHGDTPSSRMRAAGYLSGSVSYEVGENIAFGTGWLATPRAIVAGWMASPGHRANILDASFRDTGIGVFAHAPASLSEGQRGAVYTQDFGIITG